METNAVPPDYRDEWNLLMGKNNGRIKQEANWAFNTRLQITASPAISGNSGISSRAPGACRA